jgi:hypothetical protein
MYSGNLVFAQLTSYLPIKVFRKCVKRYRGDYKIQYFSCWDQFLCMAFAQLTYRESLRDIETCLRAMQGKLYHMGFRCRVSRSTLADANENRDWKIFSDFAQVLICIARELYKDDDFGVELAQTVYALDSTTIDLCLAVFPWASFRKNKGGIKIHTLLDLRGPIPSFLWVTNAKLHDVNILDNLIPEPGSYYIMDRAYLDFARLYKINRDLAFFVTRAKTNFQFRRLYSQPVDKSQGILCDQIVLLTGFYPKKDYPEKLRRIKFYDAENEHTLVFITNSFSLSALEISQLYKCRWKVELFFKWIKQHLRIKAFFGTSENAVKTQIWIAISVYVLAAIVKKRLKLDASLYTFMQILSLSLFEKDDILQLVNNMPYKDNAALNSNQMELFDL